MPDIRNRIDIGPGGRRPTVFVDLTTSLSLLGLPSTGISRIEREVASRLLKESRIVAIPCVVRAGSVYALDRTDALKLVEQPSAAEGSMAGPHAAGNDPIPSVVPAVHSTSPSMPVRATLRKWARHAVGIMPASIREDVRLVLNHSRDIVRKKVLARRVVAPPVVDAAIRSRAFEIGWPEAGDVLWTCGDYASTTPLGRIVEARRRFGFSCVAICHDLIEDEHSEVSPNDLTRVVRDCVIADLLDGSNRILCISERTRRRLLEFAARSGRDAPDARVIGCDASPVVSELTFPEELIGSGSALAASSPRRLPCVPSPTWDAAASAVVISHLIEVAGRRAG